MSQKKWILKQADTDLIKQVAKENNLPEVLATLLIHRGLKTREQIGLFMNPSRDKFYDPFLLKDMEEAVRRILQSREQQVQITIYGDYDVDGITSTSILFLFLKEIGCKVNYYIPSRIKEGYGINTNALQSLKEQGSDLVISVDTGITALEEIDFATAIGLDVIVTDHHECGEEIPRALAVINPKRSDCQYPFDRLAGVGVTFKLIQGISRRLGMEAAIWKYLDLVAVGTVADIVPLQDENRIIVQLAFKTMGNTWNLGLKALMAVAGIKTDKITAGAIGFQIGPRLNAAGRLGDAKRGVELFITTDEKVAVEIAEALDQENKKRQDMEQQLIEEAIEQIEATVDFKETKILVVAHPGWVHGVIGIAASRIVEKYYRPTILLTVEDGKASGSARSVEGFSIYEALYSCKDLFDKFGGHDMAAGMSLKEEQIPELSRRLNAYASLYMTPDTLTAKVNADLQLEIPQVDVDFIEKISLFEPYGAGNEEPKFICKGIVKDLRLMGQKLNHVRIDVASGTSVISVVGFNCPTFYEQLAIRCPVDLIGTLNVNEWQQKKSPQMMLKDLKISTSYEEKVLTILAKIHREEPLLSSEIRVNPNRLDFEKVYRHFVSLHKQEVLSVSVPKLMDALCDGKEQDTWKYWLCLEIFSELELITYTLENLQMNFHVFKGKKVELQASTLYNKWVE